MKRSLKIRQKRCPLKKSIVIFNKTYNKDIHKTQEIRKCLINTVPYEQNRL